MDPQRIGRYEILRKISAGRLAELFVAKQSGAEGFAKVVIIRRIYDELASDQEFVKSFLDEARLVARLSHPNIIQVYDLGKHGDAFFIAMEYVAGRNLARIRKRARAKGVPIPVEYAVRWAADLCAGLHYAHTRIDHQGKPLQIVHRGVAPRKVIAEFSGGLKLGEFGTAKAATQLALTRPNLLEGDYGYMSPEQVRNDKVDARSDVFSVGTLLYELVTGHHPFKRGNAILTLSAIAEERHAECADVNPDVPKSVAAIIDCALEKRRSKRWRSAEELQLALEDLLSTTVKRGDRTYMGDALRQLFAEELERGRAVIEFPGVGEIILPEVDEGSAENPIYSKPTEIVPDHATVVVPSGGRERVTTPDIAPEVASTDTEITPFHDDRETIPQRVRSAESLDATTATGLDILESPTFNESEPKVPLDSPSIETDAGQRSTKVVAPETMEGLAIALETSSFLNDRGTGADPADVPLLEFPSITERAEVSEESRPAIEVPRLDTSAFLGPAPPESESPESPEADAKLEAAFADLAMDAGGEAPPPAAPIPLPLPLPLDPAALAPIEGGNEATKKREIVEVFRPGPQAPTEFLAGMKEEAEAALRAAEASRPRLESRPAATALPEIVRMRADTVDAPVVSEVPTPPPPALVTSQETPPAIEVLPRVEAPPPLFAADKTPVPDPAYNMPFGSGALAPSPVQLGPQVVLLTPQAPVLPPGPAPSSAPPRRPRRKRMWFERWSPRVLVAIMTSAVAAALTLLALTLTRAPHELQLMITSAPTGADIYINGEKQIPKTDATIRGLKPGMSYELRIQKEGYEPAARLVAIPRESRTYVVEVRLDKLRSP